VSYDSSGASITVPTLYQGQYSFETPSHSFSFGSDSGTLASSGAPVSESNGYYVTSVDASGSMAPQRYIQPFRQSGARGVLMAQQNPKMSSAWPSQQPYILEQQPQPPSQYVNGQYVTAAGVKLNGNGASTAIVPSNAPAQSAAKL
jgi:hypothetical protein